MHPAEAGAPVEERVEHLVQSGEGDARLELCDGGAQHATARRRRVRGGGIEEHRLADPRVSGDEERGFVESHSVDEVAHERELTISPDRGQVQDVTTSVHRRSLHPQPSPTLDRVPRFRSTTRQDAGQERQLGRRATTARNTSASQMQKYDLGAPGRDRARIVAGLPVGVRHHPRGTSDVF
jgi:hypothetical protein